MGLKLSLPKGKLNKSNGASKAMQKRANRVKYAREGHGRVFLLDTSLSMGNGNMTHTDSRWLTMLQAVQENIVLESNDTLIAFNTIFQSVASIDFLPEPTGGTNLSSPMNYIAQLDEQPSSIIVLSDGYPDNPDQVLEIAKENIKGRIFTIFIGDDTDKAGISFMRQLANLGAGTTSKNDIQNLGKDKGKAALANSLLALPQ